MDTDGFDNGGALQGTPGYYVDTSLDSGLAATLARNIDQMFDSFPTMNGDRVPGVFKAREDAINDRIRNYDDRIAEMERRLGLFEDGLIMRFARLEELMGALNAQGAALAGALSTLSPIQQQ